MDGPEVCQAWALRWDHADLADGVPYSRWSHRPHRQHRGRREEACVPSSPWESGDRAAAWRWRHAATLIVEVVRFSAATRRWSLVTLIVGGLVAVGLGLLASTIAPYAVYPFV